jgi:very-long-chain (3R)-3-hydroxyacyl-CoA dehydratase
MITRYLFGYNLVSLILWLFLAIWFFLHNNGSPKQWVIPMLLVQGLAFLEIVHVLAGWVKTSLVNTAIQYFSRMFICLLIYLLFLPMNSADNNWVKAGTIMIFIAWPLAEVIRYTYYLNGKLQLFQWLRYSAFIFLYPFGVLAESFILLRFLNLSFQHAKWGWVGIICLSIVMYIFFFPKLYGYLWQQRKNKI